MAKISFTKLGLIKNQEIKTINFNRQQIEIKQYIPINTKLEMISNIINNSADDNNFANPIKISVFTALEILYNYTNINFTEKQKEDPTKLYDLVISNGLIKEVCSNIPKEEYDELISGVADSVKAFYKYKNSALGIMESISQDYSNLDFDATKIQQEIADPQNLELLKGIITKLG